MPKTGKKLHSVLKVAQSNSVIRDGMENSTQRSLKVSGQKKKIRNFAWLSQSTEIETGKRYLNVFQDDLRSFVTSAGRLYSILISLKGTGHTKKTIN